jgi:hypothetical protein
MADHFAANGSTQPIHGSATYPSAFYDAQEQRTWFAWEAWNGRREIWCRTYLHATGTWTPAVFVHEHGLVNDGHGVPAMAMDADGYVFVFYGSHNSNQHISATTNPRDPSAWTYRSYLGTGDYSYPHPCLVEQTIHLFMRNQVSSSNRRLVLRSGEPSGGALSPRPERVILDFGSSPTSRVYLAVTVIDGPDIHLCCTKSDGGDTIRRDVFHLIYSTVDGSVRNATGTLAVQHCQLPVTLSQANAYFRVAESQSETDMPAFCLDAFGVPHVVYADGTGTSYVLKHLVLDGSAPVEIGPVEGADHEGFTDSLALIPLPNGDLELWYPEGVAWTQGGDMKRRLYNPTLGWSSAIVIRAAETKALARASMVRDGHPDARVVFTEVAQSELNSAAGGLRLFAYGDTGYLVA